MNRQICTIHLIGYFLSIFLVYYDMKAQEMRPSQYDLFPPHEYAYWMKLIQEISPASYDHLKQCEATRQSPCIVKAVPAIIGTMAASEKTDGYCIIFIPEQLKKSDISQQKQSLNHFLNDYKALIPYEFKAVTVQERKQIMMIIESIAPGLYAEFIKIDPLGTNHIKRYHDDFLNLAVLASYHDGLPIIEITPDITTLPAGELRYLLGHELGHYVLGHYKEEESSAQHATLSTPEEEGEEELAPRKFMISKGKKIGKSIQMSKQLPFEETFSLAYTRNQENEADRFAVIDLAPVVSIDDAIAHEKRVKALDATLPQNKKSVFEESHPYSDSRIAYFEQLRRDVQVRKQTHPKPINWQELIVDYVQWFKENPDKIDY